jgi:2'-5' RNA ligase
VLRWTASLVDSARREGERDARGEPGAGLRWTRADQRHLTAQFLGPVADPAPLVASVATAVGGVVPFALALGGGGAFPNGRRASVVWVGVHEGVAALAALAATVSEATASCGVVPDERSYRPHLTLARSARSRDVRTLVAALDAREPSPAWTVGRILLMDSETRPDGAVHSVHADLRLAR